MIIRFLDIIQYYNIDNDTIFEHKYYCNSMKISFLYINYTFFNNILL